MCFYVRSLCCCCVSCMRCVRRRVAMLSIMSLLPSYTHSVIIVLKKTLFEVNRNYRSSISLLSV
jgi:hypothetical protein